VDIEMDWQFPDLGRLEKTGFARLYHLNVLANLLGLVTMIVVNFFTPLEFFKTQRAFFFRQGGWMILIVFWPLILLFAMLLQHYLLHPLLALKKSLVPGDKEIPKPMLERAMRRLVNLPLLIGLTNLATWIAVPLVVVAYFYLSRNAPWVTCLFVFFRSFMLGLIAASISFFLLENHLRGTLIPLFFPHGGLASLAGTIRIPIMRRIRVLYGAGTLNPMIILVGTLLFIVAEVGDNPISARELSTEMLLFTLVLCGIFVAIALGLNLLVGKSILGPVWEMMRVIKEVKRGDFGEKIGVISNDEIGVLGDAGNDMIKGLAERERIRETFGRYVTPEIRDRILEGLIPLNGERRAATVLFADLRDFTPYVEETTPEEVVTSIRVYFTSMQKAIRSHQGLILQYVGDEIEAAFGIPLPCDHHADEAVQAALEMRRGLEDLNRKRLAEGKPPFRHGIGIHTGMVLAGNTGSEDQLSYALIGETVNLASRIQQLTKRFHCDILVSEETMKTLNGSFQLQRESPLTVKGYSKPVTVYRVL
jgi:adenylate cyclase